MKEVGTGIIVCDGKIFIGQRPEGKPLAGLWEFPGGKQEAGESIEECLIRELREELNVEAKIGKHIMDTVYRYDENEFRLHVYFVTIPDDAKITLNVHQNSAWVTPQEMSNYAFPPADEAIIQKLIDLL
ncbi:MAG: (deoxy)nucleoside triphosphate pyrophosphohydrolase [Alphaproteobacteria bacterium]|nr:(deoxy)nucleoside triphosphate pyrophosphohydrolase [Alphaproteobacteria bacterium]